jgi:hypothetical protein
MVRTALADWPFADAPIVDVVWFVGDVVVTVKFADVEPAGTVAVEGTEALLPLAVKATDSPPAGAGPLIVTVAVETPPPPIETGFSDRPDTTGGLIVKLACCEIEPVVAVIVGVVTFATPIVATLKVVEVAPEGTVIEAGTDAVPVLDESFTKMPAEGAA